jgi:hypothetical protein
MLLRETVAVYHESHEKHNNALNGQNEEFYYVKLMVPVEAMMFKKRQLFNM